MSSRHLTVLPLLLPLLLLCGALCHVAVAGKYTQYVDTLIGAGGFGFGAGSINPGVQVPFGALRLGPDTSDGAGQLWFPFQHFGGYAYDDTMIRAFSHTHLVGAGLCDWGNVGVMPVRAVSEAIFGPDGYSSKFNHSSETAVPGYYSVYLDTPQTLAEFTVSGTLSAMHRYTFDDAQTSDGFLVFDVCHSLNSSATHGCRQAFVTVSGTSISGGVLMNGDLTGNSPTGGVWVYFVATVDAPTFNATVWANSSFLNSAQSASSSSGSLGVVLRVVDAASSVSNTSVVFVRVAISFVSVAHAVQNLAAQQQVTDFDTCRQSADALWDAHLSVVQAAGPAFPDGMTKFYSAVYRTLLAPSRYSESDGSYMGMDQAVHQWPFAQGHFMSDMSIWDIHRTQSPWLAFLRPDVARDIARSLLLMYHQGGRLPKWPIANVYTNAMTGEHQVIMLSDYIAKGVTGFNYSLALQAALDSVNSQDDSMGFAQYGFVPSNFSGNAASITLDCAFDDWAVAQMAMALNESATASLHMTRSQFFKNTWSAQDSVFCPKSPEGVLTCPANIVNPYPFENHYTESDALQYSWFVPGDPEGLVALFPSPAAYVQALNQFFVKSIGWFWGNVLPNPYYWPGNEPDIFAPWQFSFAGAQYANFTQYWTRYQLQHAFTIEPSGLPGNDDFGTMSAWACWAFIGLYPVAGSTRYVLGSPALSKVTFDLHSNASLTILAHNNTANNTFVARVELNGLLWSSPFIDHHDLVVPNGQSQLEFWMTA